MSDDELKEYAKQLILEHAKEVEILTVWEQFEEIEDDGDANRIIELIQEAVVTVSWGN